MEVHKRNIEQIFDPTTQLEAPLFQRPYVWRQLKNWQPLWDSIQDLADKRAESTNARPHFLGAVVLDQIPNAHGTIAKRQIIDGQQRLTTLQLALAAIRDICQAAGAEGSPKAAAYQDAFAKLTRNHIPLSDEPDEIFKIYPTNADRSHFRIVMGADTHEVARQLVANAGDSDALIPRAYLYFHQTISDWLGTPHNEDEFIKRAPHSTKPSKAT
jgi:hypothetical protein